MIQTLSISELFEKTKNLGPKELILDVRYAEEYAEGHVPGSQNISHELVASHVDELRKYDKIYLYCRSGGRVQKAAFELLRLGMKNIVGIIDGGMPDWVRLGFPVEKK